MINWDSLSTNMKNAVVSTLENITFSFVDDYPEDFANTSFEPIETDLSITIKETTLIIRITVPQEFLKGIVSTLYAHVEESDISSYYADTLNELSNTICGIFFRSLESELGTFQLGIPHLADKSELQELASYHFLIDDQFPIKLVVSN